MGKSGAPKTFSLRNVAPMPFRISPTERHGFPASFRPFSGRFPHVRKNLVLQEAVELPLDGFFVFWGLALFPQWDVLLRRVGELFKTWASRVTARATPGEFPASARSTARPVEAHVCVGGRLEPKKERTWSYMKKNSRRPCAPHGQKEFCTENKKEHIRKKVKFFRKNFCSR